MNSGGDHSEKVTEAHKRAYKHNVELCPLSCAYGKIMFSPLYELVQRAGMKGQHTGVVGDVHPPVETKTKRQKGSEHKHHSVVWSLLTAIPEPKNKLSVSLFIQFELFHLMGTASNLFHRRTVAIKATRSHAHK